MTFADTVHVHTSLPAWRRLARGGVAMAAAAVLLSACGGGDQVKEFRAAKMVSFGDEYSALVSGEVSLTAGGTATVHGLKYSVNHLEITFNTKLGEVAAEETQSNNNNALLPNIDQALWAEFPQDLGTSYSTLSITGVDTSNGTDAVVLRFADLQSLVTGSVQEPANINYRYVYSCFDSPLWIQVVARKYRLGFNSQCPSVNEQAGAVTYAAGGATVADTAAQAAAHRGELNADTLVTLMAGQNDVLQAYAQVKAGTLTLDAAKASMTTQGGALSAIANDIIKTGARVVLVRLGDLGLSPLAIQDGGDGQSRLRALTLAFNNGLLNKLKNDGHKIVLFNFYDQTHYIYEAVRDGKGAYDNITNMSVPVCSDTVRRPDGTRVVSGSVAPLYAGEGLLHCNLYTINSGVTLDTYFWASKTHLSPAGHAFLGARVVEQLNDSKL